MQADFSLCNVTNEPADIKPVFKHVWHTEKNFLRCRTKCVLKVLSVKVELIQQKK